MGAAEDAVVQAALERGFVTRAQVDEARRLAAQGGNAGGFLGALARHLDPAQRAALRAVWQEANGQESTRADAGTAQLASAPSADDATLAPAAAAPAGDATLAPPGAGADGFDSAGATLVERPAGFDPGAATIDASGPASFDPGAATLAPSEQFPATAGALPTGTYDPTAATMLEAHVIPVGPPPEGDFRDAHTLIEGPPPPREGDFRDAQTLMEAPPRPQEGDFRDAQTLVENRPAKPGETGPRGTIRAEQTEVARRAGEGHTKADDPRSTAPMSGVSPSLMSQTATGRRERPARTLPDRIGGYKPVRELGRGGMGVVYEALDAADRPVALKVLLGGVSASEQAVQRFLIEGKATARMKHPHVVELYYLSERPDEEGRWYLAMELVRGTSLKEKIDKSGPLDEEAAVQLTIKLADALAYAHERQVLHRDIKPHNVLLDERGEPKLTDFGLAKLVGDQQHQLTATGPSVMGTPGFMPPEQAGGSTEKPDVRADVYSLGATLFHMLTGRPPFQEESVARVLMAVVKSPPPLISSFRPDVSRDLETIVLKCLEKRPADRYQTALELKADLQRFLDQQQILATRAGLVTRLVRWVSANPTSAVGSLLVGAALVTLGGLQARQALFPPPPPPPRWGNGGVSSIASLTSAEQAALASNLALLGSDVAVLTSAQVAAIRSEGVASVRSEMQAELAKDRTPPTLQLLSPAPGTRTSKGAVEVSVLAADDVSVAEVLLECGNAPAVQLLPNPAAGEGQYLGRWDLGETDGELVGHVIARDAAGNLSTPLELRVEVDRTVPQVKGFTPNKADPQEWSTAGETFTVYVPGVAKEITASFRVELSEPARAWATVRGEDERPLGGGELAQVHTITLRRLREGQQVELQVRAEDEFGNRTAAPVLRTVRRERAPWLRDAWWEPLDAQRQAARAGRPVCLKNDLGMELVLVPPGTVQRGAGEARVTAAFYLGATEVSNAQLRDLVPHASPEGLDGADQPAVDVTREEVETFLRLLNERHPRAGGVALRYRLPSEAEWELACRAFQTRPWWEPLESFVHGGAGAKGQPSLGVRAGVQPSPLGLFHMLGNAEEWCEDYWATTVLIGENPRRTDPDRAKPDWEAQPHGPPWVAKGGSWQRKQDAGAPDPFTPEFRFAWGKPPFPKHRTLGFRVLAEPAE